MRVRQPHPQPGPADDQHGRRDAQHVGRAEALVGQQEKIAHRHDGGKGPDDIGRPAHETLRRRDEAHHQGPDRPRAVSAQIVDQVRQAEQAQHEEEDRQAEHPDRAVRKALDLSLPHRGEVKDPRYGQKAAGQAIEQVLPAREVPGDAVVQDAEWQRAQRHGHLAGIEAVRRDALPAGLRLRDALREGGKAHLGLEAVRQKRRAAHRGDALRVKADPERPALRGRLKAQRESVGQIHRAEEEDHDPDQQRRQDRQDQPFHLSRRWRSTSSAKKPFLAISSS